MGRGGLLALVSVAGGFVLLAGAPGVLTHPEFTEADLAAELPADFRPDSERGRKLYHLGGCGNCHSDAIETGRIGGAPSGGYALKSFVGDFYPPNLTPDADTGIGRWSNADFVNAMKLGISPEGQHYYPAFPYTSYAKASLTDLVDLKAYLDSLDPVSSPARAHDIRFPYGFRPALYYWKLLFHDAGEFAPAAETAAGWNLGAYLVDSLGHCGVCHTPRNLLWAENSNRAFEGGSRLAEGESPAPRLAGLDPLEILNGLDEWSGAVSESSSMHLVTQSYSAHAASEELDAIADYLSGLSYRQ